MKNRFLLRNKSLGVPKRVPWPPLRCVELRIDPGEDLLARLAETVEGRTDWRVAEWFSRSDGAATLALDYLDDTSSAKEGLRLIVSFIQEASTPNLRLLFEDHKEHTPDWTYESYVTATTFLKPLLRAYNRRYCTRKRLIVPSAESLEPWLLFDEAVAFDFFRDEACVRPLSFEAQDRLCWFVYVAAKARNPISVENFCRLMELNGIEDDEEATFVSIFRYGMKLLQVRKSSRCWPQYAYSSLRTFIDRSNRGQWVE